MAGGTGLRTSRFHGTSLCRPASKITPAQPHPAPGGRSWEQVLGDMGHSSRITNCVQGGGLNRCSPQEIWGWELLPTSLLLQKLQCQAKSLCAPQGHRRQKTSVVRTQASSCPSMINVLCCSPAVSRAHRPARGQRNAVAFLGSLCWPW